MTDKLLIDRAVVEQALEALQYAYENLPLIHAGEIDEKLEALRAALEQPVEQEPVAWRVWRGDAYELFFSKYAASQRADCFTKRPDVEPLYTSPQTAKQPLTDAEIDSLWAAIPNQALYKAVRAFARAVEATIWEKSNG